MVLKVTGCMCEAENSFSPELSPVNVQVQDFQLRLFSDPG